MTNTVSRASLESQGRAIVEGLGGKWSPNGAMCCCPAHNDSSPSLSVRVGERSLLFHCFSGCETTDVLRALRSGGHVDRSGVRTTTDVERRETVDAGAMAKRLWDASRPITGTLAQDYLAQREISASSAELRFHPRTQLGRKPDARFFPALIAAIRDDNGLVAVHRTFLDLKTARKAPIEDPKRMLGRPGTGAVRLSQPGEVLGLAEGVETALSAMEILGIPVWAVVGNERFGMVAIPKTVRRLILLPDPDNGGRRAAELAQNQAREGLSIEILLPPGGGGDRRGQDWNDIAMGKRGKKAAAV